MVKSALKILVEKIRLYSLYFYKKYKKAINKFIIILLFLLLLLLVYIVNDKYNLFYWWTIPNYLLLWFLIGKKYIRYFFKLLNYCWVNIVTDLTWFYNIIINYLYGLYLSNIFIFLIVVVLIIIAVIVLVILAHYVHKKYKEW